MSTHDDLLYSESITGKWTTALFVALTAVFSLLFAWRLNGAGWDTLAIVFLCLGAMFLFYVVNYRKLVIRITAESLRLTFGVFTWTVPLDNVESAQLDGIAGFMRYGGAGIHFMSIGKRYRASFNFLEYPRVVIAFQRKVGLVRDISFTTRRPDAVLRVIRDATSPGAGSSHA